MKRILLVLSILLAAAAARAQDEIVDVIYEINAPPTVAPTHTMLGATHSDTVVSTPNTNDVLAWNGSAWAAASPSGLSNATGASLLLGRGSAAGGGAWEEITLGSNLTMTNKVLSASAASGAPTGASYITKVAEAGLSAETAMGTFASGLVLNETVTGNPSIYAGASCTNQFVRALSASGAATCASVANGDLAGAIDLTTKVTGILPSANGGSNSAYFAVAGPASSAKTYTFPNANATVKTGSTNNYRASFTLENPTSGENITMFYTPNAITITEVRCVVKGPTSPSVTYNVKYGTDRSAAGTSVTTAPAACTNTTTGVAATLNNTAPTAGAYLWLTTSAQSGTVTDVNVTVTYTEP